MNEITFIVNECITHELNNYELIILSHYAFQGKFYIVSNVTNRLNCVDRIRVANYSDKMILI